MKALVLVFCKCLESILDLTPPPSAQLCRAWALAHVRDNAWIVLTLVSNTLATPSDEITRVLHLFHSLADVDFPPFCWWFPSWDEGYFKLKSIYLCFASITTCFFQWLFKYGVWIFMIFFFLNDFTNGFDLFFKVCGHIVWGDIPPSISCFFFASRFLTLEK